MGIIILIQLVSNNGVASNIFIYIYIYLYIYIYIYIFIHIYNNPKNCKVRVLNAISRETYFRVKTLKIKIKMLLNFT